MLFSEWIGGYSGADVVSNLCAVGAIVHEEDVKVLDVLDGEFFKAVGEVVPGLFVRPVTDLGHLLVAPESSPHAVVDT